MKHLLFSTVAVFCIVTTGLTQNQWMPGFIVTTNNDTLKTQLSVKAIESYVCRTLSSDGTEKDYTPDELKAFWVDGGYSFQTISLPGNNEKQFATVFARGRADLLKYRSRFFLIDSLDALFELETTIKEKEVDGRLVQITLEKFKQTLMWKLADCKQATLRISATTLDEPSLVKLFNVYNSCFGDAVDVRDVSPGRETSFQVGVEYGSLKTKLGSFSDAAGTIDRGQFGNYEQTFVGGYFRYAPGHYKGVSFDAGVQSLQFVFHSVKTLSSQTLTYDARFSTIRIPFGVSYSFFSWRKIQPFVRLGASFHANRGTLIGTRQVDFNDGTTATGVVLGIHPANWGIMSEVGVNVKLGPIMIGVRGSLERMTAALYTNNIQFAYDMQATQTNYGVAASIGYVFIKR